MATPPPRPTTYLLALEARTQPANIVVGMALVAYSDSEGSDTEEAPQPSPKATQNLATQRAFAVDKANPKKIRVNLTELSPAPSGRGDGEPAAKRLRVGAGPFSGFNAMLPPPKRADDKPVNGSSSGPKAPARKVFSLKTGAEPAFSRESDAELKQLFAEQEQEPDQEHEQEQEEDGGDSTIHTTRPTPPFISDPPKPTTTQGNTFMFKPLSVARTTKKKKKPAGQEAAANSTPALPSTTSTLSQQPSSTDHPPDEPKQHSPKKISLFSFGATPLPADLEETSSPSPKNEDDEIVELLDGPTTSTATATTTTTTTTSDSLTSIAHDLNLSAAERRQLFGRTNGPAGSGAKIINFNTDAEYAANQASIAAGEQVQHAPVRSIAPGKHSLKSLVASAQGQKDALEESFAAGRRNKREVGSRYGW